ncbi:hypothetical protein D3C71_958150 [compost metagenome]
MLGHADDMDAVAAFNAGVGVGQHVEHASARAHLLHVALELFEQGVIGRHGDYGHGTGHQGQGTVLEFTGRVGLGVDVADFLELQGAFQRNGVVQAPAQKECVFHAGKVFGPADDLWLQRQHGLQGHGQVAHGFEVGGFLLVAQTAFGLG